MNDCFGRYVPRREHDPFCAECEVIDACEQASHDEMYARIVAIRLTDDRYEACFGTGPQECAAYCDVATECDFATKVNLGEIQ